jgi:sulfhydrogenase subunit beta (sulfur reductase)
MGPLDAADGCAVIDRAGLGALVEMLKTDGYLVIGPQVADGAIVLGELDSADRLPAGWRDEQDGGRYRLVRRQDDAVFAHAAGPQSWKRYLFPPVEKLWSAERRDDGFDVVAEDKPAPAYAFLGVRACDLHAIRIQDRVFQGHIVDPGYAARREQAFIIAVNCTRAGGTCFCVSMDTGPKVDRGYDLALTELVGGGRHEFLVQVGSERGAGLIARLPRRADRPEDHEAADAGTAAASASMGRRMVPGVESLLKRNLEHPRWDEVATRCLSCANCTLVCPTCFCHTVEDTTDLTGDHAERWRRWDSCFTLEFSYIHGGSIRRQTRSRYR